MYIGIPQIFIHFRVLSRQLLRAKKGNEKKYRKGVLQVSSGRHGWIRIHICSVSMCVAWNRKNTAHPHVFVFVFCRSRNLSTISDRKDFVAEDHSLKNFRSTHLGYLWVDECRWKNIAEIISVTATHHLYQHCTCKRSLRTEMMVSFGAFRVERVNSLLSELIFLG